MAYRRREISIGFTERPFLSGSHICYLFGDDDERFRVLAQFIAAGSRDRERILYLSDTLPVDGVRSALLREGAELGEPGQSLFMPAEDGYLSNGKFSSQATLAKIQTFFENSISAGYRGARGTGEMSWALRGVPGVEDVMEYEARLTGLLECYPYTAICQYDIRRFDGATLMDVLSVHPYSILRGQIVDNPYFIPPEQFLRQYTPRRPFSAAAARE